MLLPRVRTALAFCLVVLALVVPRTARAERDLIVPFQEGGRLVLDQLSGMRVNAANGVSYAGPLGVAFHASKAEGLTPGAAADQTKTTTLWLAPSADVFVTEHLSLGGTIEVSHTFGSTSVNGQDVSLPGTTSMTFVPRVGFYVPIGDRFGVWPRLGLGYARTQSAAFAAQGGTPVRETFQSMLLEADLALVYRFDETFFLRAGPAVSLTIGGRREQEAGGVQAAADASVLSFSGVVGFGVNLDP